MRDYLQVLIQKYASKGVLVDSNLFLLLLIGNMDSGYILQFKRTRKYAPEDYELLRHFLNNFPIQVTIPHILTEVSNLAQAQKRSRQAFWTELKKSIDQIEETYLTSRELAQRPECARFGLTDTCIIALMEHQVLLLTDDFDLAQYVQHKGGDVINFNHLRGQNW